MRNYIFEFLRRLVSQRLFGRIFSIEALGVGAGALALWLSLVALLFLKGIAIMAYLVGLTHDTGLFTVIVCLITANEQMFGDGVARGVFVAMSLIWLARLALVMLDKINPWEWEKDEKTRDWPPYLRRLGIKTVLLSGLCAILLLGWEIIHLRDVLISLAMIFAIILGFLAELPALYSWKMMSEDHRRKNILMLEKWLFSLMKALIVAICTIGAISIPVEAAAVAGRWVLGDEIYEGFVGSDKRPGVIQEVGREQVCKQSRRWLGRTPDGCTGVSQRAPTPSDTDEPREAAAKIKRLRCEKLGQCD